MGLLDLAFVDCETTGLDPDRHEIWELAVVSEKGDLHAHLPVDLRRADPTGLRVGRFYDRYEFQAINYGTAYGTMHRNHQWDEIPPGRLAWEVARRLDGHHMVGAVPNFDAEFIARWLRAHGQAPTWHYHLIDVEALAVGWLHGADPSAVGKVYRRNSWDSNILSRAVGVDPDEFDRHTALGDARWAKALYEAVTR